MTSPATVLAVGRVVVTLVPKYRTKSWYAISARWM